MDTGKERAEEGKTGKGRLEMEYKLRGGERKKIDRTVLWLTSLELLQIETFLSPRAKIPFSWSSRQQGWGQSPPLIYRWQCLGILHRIHLGR